MAGTGHNHQQTKHSYFHCNNSPVFNNKTTSVCTSIHQDQSMMSSSTSPWYHPTAISGDNDDLTFCNGTNLPPVPPPTTMSKPSSSVSLNTDCTNTNQPPYENYGHFFVKKTFHKPTYCHHCVEMLWGLIGQGYYCEGITKKYKGNFILFYSCLSMQFYLSRSLSKTCHIAMLKHRTYTYKSIEKRILC